ncbi:MAG: UDP-3-O-(3-hydroxymyristoyl)glucosamine N-acyltransferase [Bacteroidetes bacterium]|nr:UDP-3-O-(3-hydroxymyristoyl)glucosamine N-acyltransferase [Bacteroidota bacterium]MBV6462467.1 UDP-3-O-acylglucosamine N-acyltransferase [Flavobacteriales bacterium]WKZ74366.1 MAG: UDP-3-O-(3-hydroxymyristoyl)glucosamine N-acyltransferase [Vicingaceae bacterium]MCL4817013.1 UDP-3-O-(3-hydroxymyristoyl)glucosamine N-acyltransferase [Flavobacteriales bacterium]NOG94692.1 UDP-3-O-(3-hydroxymyristoyl)glucosamine N-acyltransferase [Bacteroidota bacterium]
MEFTAKNIAELLQGEIEGNPNVSVSSLSKIEEGCEGAITFLSNPKYEPYIYTTKASVVIVNKSFIAESKLPQNCTLIRVSDSYIAFTKLLEAYNHYKNNKKGIEQPCYISKTAIIGENVYIGAFTHIGENVKIGGYTKIYPNCTIGENTTIEENTTLYSNVTVYHDCKIGKNCTLHSGVIIGADGFGFAPDQQNHYNKVPQIGNVIIEDNVEIGANTCIDRATLGSTLIKKGVKIDNLVQIAHNVVIGENTVIVSQTGIAGSTKIGKNCLIGGQVGIVGHLTIADGVKIAAQSGIGSNIPQENAIVQGSPAFAVGDYKRAYVGFKKLPEILERLNKIERLIIKADK